MFDCVAFVDLVHVPELHRPTNLGLEHIIQFGLDQSSGSSVRLLDEGPLSSVVVP